MLTCTICISLGSPLSRQLGCSSRQSSSASPALFKSCIDRTLPDLSRNYSTVVKTVVTMPTA
jgi:hypothetical protein